jgi:hypothetical protein
MRRSGLRQDEKGQAAVETLLVLMLFVLVIFAGIELSRGIAIRHALDSSTSAAARALSLDPSNWQVADALVQDGLQRNVMGFTDSATLMIYDASGTQRSSVWLSGSPFGTSFLLEASAPFQADIPFMQAPLLQIRVQHWGIVERYP